MRWSAHLRVSARPAFGAWWGRSSALFLWLVVVLAGCAKSAATAARAPNVWPAQQLHSDAGGRERVALTVYDNFALVREERRLRLETGRVALAYEDVAARLDPQTVLLRALGDRDDLAVLEQNYQYDLLTPETLLGKYVGRRVSLVRHDRAADADVTREADVLASASGPVLRVAGEVTSLAPDERIRFPELPPGLLARPTLVWLLDSQREEQRVEVSYLTQGLSWRADYVLTLDDDEAHADLIGWVTLDNQSGASFRAATLQLMAGDVRRVAAPAPMEFALADEDREQPGMSPLAEQSLFEYHLYSLDRATDVLDRESKQVQLLEARRIAVARKLVLRRNSPLSSRWSRTLNAAPVPLEYALSVAVIDNRQSAGLGLPLPRGVVRVYRRDQGGAQQFVGEDAIQHVPRDEPVEITLGQAFDVVAERHLLQVRQLERCVQQQEWQISLRNHQQRGVTVEVVEPASGEWHVVSSTLPAAQRDATTFVFQVPVPARGAAELRYQLRTRSCG